MAISHSRNKTGSRKTKPIHIVIAIREVEAMSSGGNNHSPGIINHHQSHGQDDPSQPQRGTPRRPSMAIQDMLNPVTGERSHKPRNNGSIQDGGNGPYSNAYYAAQRNHRPDSFPSVNSNHGPLSISPTPSSNLGDPPPRASGNQERRRVRPTYLEEEVYFIWYYRIDLGYDWQEISNAYNAQFPDRQRDGFGGMQCKYYRYCEGSGIPKVRDRNRAAPQVSEYGMRARTNLTYSWMRD